MMLKDLLKSKMKSGYIVPVLESTALVEGSKDALYRKRNCFHPSEISRDFCPRAWVLSQRDMSLYYNRSIDAQLQWVFDVGKAIHELVQTCLGNSGKLFGTWTCARQCNGEACRYVGFKPADNFCMKCSLSSPKWEYEEVPIVDEELGIEGRTDGIVVLDTGKFVFEFKTIASKVFATLAEAVDFHREQAAWYLDILERNKIQLEKQVLELTKYGVCIDEQLRIVRQPYRGAIIVYMNKDTQQFKEFVITLDKAVTMPNGIKIKGMEMATQRDELEDKKALLLETLKMYNAGVLPKRLDMCTSKSCPRAKNCYAKAECFKEE